MGKEITLPIGMVISEANSIGDYALVAGSTYNVTNITMYRIADVIGAGAVYDLKALALHSNINKWAAFKPSGNTHPSGMTVDTFNIVYQKPTFEYVMGDFAGYNHNAETPGELIEQSPFTYTSDGILNITEFVKFPEFDLREIDPSIDGVISENTTQAVDPVYTAITDTHLNEGYMGFGVDIQCNVNNISSSANIKIDLGYLSGSTPVFHAYFPHAGTGELIIPFTVYNMSVPTLTAMFEPGPTEEIDDVIVITWQSRSSLIRDNYQLYRKVNSGTPVLIVTTTNEGYEDYDFTPGNTYSYYVVVNWLPAYGTSDTTNTVDVVVPA